MWGLGFVCVCGGGCRSSLSQEVPGDFHGVFHFVQLCFLTFPPVHCTQTMQTKAYSYVCRTVGFGQGPPASGVSMSN